MATDDQAVPQIHPHYIFDWVCSSSRVLLNNYTEIRSFPMLLFLLLHLSKPWQHGHLYEAEAEVVALRTF